MIKTYCMNCYQNKPVELYSEPYCLTCESTRMEAREYAQEQKLDEGAVIKQALASRQPKAMDNRDPRIAFDRVNTDALHARLAIPDADIQAPNRGKFYGR